MEPKEIVARGYDRIAESYVEWAAGARVEERERYTALVLQSLPPGSRVLDLGCGAGVPTTKLLAGRFVVTGVDISERQIELARKNVPDAMFVRADMASLNFPPRSFDGVAAFYSITHVPREEHPGLLRRIAGWLRAGGVLVAALGSRPSEGDIEEDWLGAPMYFSHYGSETNRRLVEAAGLEVVNAVDETSDEDGAPATFLWVVARKPAGR